MLNILLILRISRHCLLLLLLFRCSVLYIIVHGRSTQNKKKKCFRFKNSTSQARTGGYNVWERGSLWLCGTTNTLLANSGWSPRCAECEIRRVIVVAGAVGNVEAHNRKLDVNNRAVQYRLTKILEYFLQFWNKRFLSSFCQKIAKCLSIHKDIFLFSKCIVLQLSCILSVRTIF